MLTELVVAWDTSATGHAPSAEARRALAEWALARGVRLQPQVESPIGALVVDPSVAESVEGYLERARDAVTAGDSAAAESALESGETLLRRHAETPQAAWLMAELERARALRWSRLPPHDTARAASAWDVAASLDGGRAGGVGEPLAAPTPTSTLRPRRVRVVLEDGSSLEPAGLVPFLDGVQLVGDGRMAAEGEHQVVLKHRGTPVWAAWVRLGADGVISAPSPPTAPCSAGDLARTRVGPAVEAVGVRCTDWVAVVEDEGAGGVGALRLATCSGASCGPVVSFRVGALGPVLTRTREDTGGFPAWATWAIVGGAAVAVTFATLAATGTFRPTQDQPLFTTGGLRPASSPLRLLLGR